MKLGTIEEEARACREAFKGVKVGALVWHCHHGELLEALTEAPENRIAYIIRMKSPAEIPLRLHLFRPVRHVFRSHAYAEWQKAHAEWWKAEAKWEKADAAWDKASAELQNASAEQQKAHAEWQKARAEWERAYVEWKKADAKWEKACAKWERADAAEIEAAHLAECPDCPWDGYTIFP